MKFLSFSGGLNGALKKKRENRQLAGFLYNSFSWLTNYFLDQSTSSVLKDLFWFCFIIDNELTNPFFPP